MVAAAGILLGLRLPGKCSRGPSEHDTPVQTLTLVQSHGHSQTAADTTHQHGQHPANTLLHAFRTSRMNSSDRRRVAPSESYYDKDTL